MPKSTEVTNLEAFANDLLDQYSKQSLKEIAKAMKTHSIMLRRAGLNTYRDEDDYYLSDTWDIEEAMRQVSFYLQEYIIPKIGNTD